MPKLFIFLLLLCSLQMYAQHKVTFVIQHAPGSKGVDSTIYLAGNFNGWNPHNEAYVVQNKTLTVTLPPGTIAFKFTRGSWDKAEVAKGGTSIDNRTMQIGKDTVISIDIEGWADLFPAPQKMSTANSNVKVIDTAFFMPQLGRHRRIWIYLPKGYELSQQKYPVLYLQDGQNVFDEKTSFSGEWGIDEALDTLSATVKPCIVVAIDNGGEKRLSEYAPFDFTLEGAGNKISAEGDLYIDFMVKTLKPFIEKHYRVSTKKSDNFIAGSSLGGLISYYAVLKYPNEFGAAGVFSPAFWVAPQLTAHTASVAGNIKNRFYFYAGAGESERMVPDMTAIVDALNSHSQAQVQVVVRPEGKHTEATWRSEFPAFYKWLMQ